jgi:hypothetical protein
MWDITNQYIWEGVNGGLFTMVLFILIIVFCFRAVGRTVRRLPATDRRAEGHLVWALGATLFAHTASFMSISYFDQNVVNWYMLLAMIATAAAIRKTVPAVASAKKKPIMFSATPELAIPKSENLYF